MFSYLILFVLVLSGSLSARIQEQTNRRSGLKR